MKKKAKKKTPTWKKSWNQSLQARRMKFCWDRLTDYNAILWHARDRVESNKKSFNLHTSLTREEREEVLAADLRIKESDLFGPEDKEYLEVGESWEDSNGDIEPTARNVFDLVASVEAMAMMAVSKPS